MKSIIIPSEQNKVFQRINLLSENSQRLWGKMNVNQMIVHCTDQIRMAEGKIKIEYVGNLFLKTIGKNLVLLGLPAPKEKIKTYKELDQKISGTKPTNFENDKSILIQTIKTFDKEYPENSKIVHPSFGEMDKVEWGKLIYVHLDHHLRQFGV